MEFVEDVFKGSHASVKYGPISHWQEHKSLSSTEIAYSARLFDLILANVTARGGQSSAFPPCPPVDIGAEGGKLKR